MPIPFSCSCGKKLQVKDELAGKKVKCPACAKILTVPQDAEVPLPETPVPVATAPPPKQPPAPAPEPRPKAQPATAKAPRKPEPEPEEEAPPPEESEADDEAADEATPSVARGMLAKNKFVVKQHTAKFSAIMAYEIADGDSGRPLGLAKPNVSLWAKLLSLLVGKDNMSLSIEVREKADDALVFVVRRSGFLFKKVQVLDARGKVVGRYKAKRFSLSGGFHIYDKNGKHFAEIQGKMFKAEYKFLTPDGEAMGSVSRTWGGLAKSLLTGAGTYGVEIEPEYAEDAKAKMLILGAAIAINAMFQKKGSKGEKGGSEGGGDMGGADE